MWKAFATLVTAMALAGCAGLHELSNDVSTYSQWPADRKPASYVFERLPSQQTYPQQQQRLEDAARRAIEGAGFAPAADPKNADFTIQVGARVSANERSLYDDPFWWHGGLYHSRHFGRPFWGTGFGMMYTTQTYEREVALLIRDRKTGQPLFEARATNDGASPTIDSLLTAMFDAAMKDFPLSGINPRRVVTRIDS
ncbi:DUF4136 domain-containing protein [Piscinibacter sp.]|jgi:hypothetical protein|uniref:DUF4136 domain-containing protein n=1 Tax=Piscinibacter sp. TaxID=1903157 RepID=UPI003559E47C